MDGRLDNPGALRMGIRGGAMREPDEVAAMIRLRGLGWGVRRKPQVPPDAVMHRSLR